MKNEASIGLAIGTYLHDHGIKQTYLAKKAGLTDSVVSDICNGFRSNKNLSCLAVYKICMALGVPVDTFINDELLEV